MTTTSTTAVKPVAPPSAPELAADLDAGLRRLKLTAIRRTAPEVLLIAKTQRWTPEEVLRTLVETELAAREGQCCSAVGIGRRSRPITARGRSHLWQGRRRRAGRGARSRFTDAQIPDIVALVVQFSMTNYFNNVMKTDIDVFPKQTAPSTP